MAPIRTYSRNTEVAVIVTIDGPAGAGKSSVARGLAQRLGFRFLDTGAMYRVVTLAALERDVDWEDAGALAALAGQVRIELEGDRVLLDGRDVSEPIRSCQITTLSRHMAGNRGVRARLVQLQRDAVRGCDAVTEGRDQGTVVFPDAQCKIFLTAGPEERARRRHRELQARGERVSVEEVLAKQEARDRRDASRQVGPLVRADDAIEFSTDGLELDQVIDRLEGLVRIRMGAAD